MKHPADEEPALLVVPVTAAMTSLAARAAGEIVLYDAWQDSVGR